MGRDVFGFSDFVFEIMTESLGPLKFRRISKTYATKIEKADFQNDLPPEAFLSLLIVILGVKSDGSTISVEESYALSQAEREAFAEAFLAEHKEFWREMTIEEVVNEQGQKIIRNIFSDEISNPRHSGEDLIPYLTRLYRDFNKGIITRESRKMEPQRKLIEERSAGLSSGEKELLLQNATLSESLGRTLAQMRALEGVIQTNPITQRPVQAPPQHLPPAPTLPGSHVMPGMPAPAMPVPAAPGMAMPGMSPPAVHPSVMPSPSMQMMVQPAPMEPVVAAPRALTPLSEATERMNEVLTRIDAVEPMAVETLGMMKSLNDASVQILANFSAAAEKNARSAKRAVRVAILAFLIALLVPAAPYLIEFYKERWQPGYVTQKRAEEARAAQAIADQKQQIDTLKATVEELRAQRAARPTPFAD